MNRYLFFGLLAAGILFRVAMLTNYGLVNGGEVDVYLADEGIVGLMAKHIAEGRELPVFFYGQDYLGALEAYCVALSFVVFGVGVTSLRLVPFLFSLGLLAVVYRFTYKAYSVAAARWATALVAVAPMYFLQWNLKARGGFVEHVVLLFVVLVLFWRFYFGHERGVGRAFALGVAAGVALWVNQLVLGYLVVLTALLAVSSDKRAYLPLLAGGMLGAALLIGYNVVHPLTTARALARKAVVLNRVPVDERDEGWLLRGVEKRVGALEHGLGKLGLVFGVPPGSGVERLGLTTDARDGGPLTHARRVLWPVPFAVFGAAVIAALPRRGPAGWDPFGSSHLLVVLLAVTFVVGYVSPRYMLPAYPLAAMIASALVARLHDTRRLLMASALAAVFAFNVASWADAAAAATPEEEQGARLLEFLSTHGLDRCYSAAPLYHLVFESGERILLVPLQKDRYPAYNNVVERSDSVCYVFRDDQRSKRQHVAMMAHLADESVTYRSATVGPYRVFWDFDPRGALSGDAIDRIREPRDRALLGGL